MKIKILLIICVLITACQNGKTNRTNPTGANLQNVEKNQYPKMPVVLQGGDSIVYRDAKFTVVTSKLSFDENGAFDIHLYNNKTRKKTDYTSRDFNAIQIFYQGVLKNYLLIDDGTGSMRYLHIIDMNTGESMLSFSYCSEIEIKEDKIFYDRKIETLPQGVPSPKCPANIPPESLGYVEKCYFDANIGEIVAMGEYKCRYFE